MFNVVCVVAVAVVFNSLGKQKNTIFLAVFISLSIRNFHHQYRIGDLLLLILLLLPILYLLLTKFVKFGVASGLYIIEEQKHRG